MADPGQSRVEENLPACQEDSYDERIPHLLRDLVGLPFSIIQLSSNASRIAASLPSPSSSMSLWSLPPGLHIFVGVNSSTISSSSASSSSPEELLPEPLVSSLHRLLQSPLFPGRRHLLPSSTSSILKLFAPVPLPLVPALADVVLPTGHLGGLYWYHAPLHAKEEEEISSLEAYGYLPDPYAPRGLQSRPVGYRIALEQSSALGLSRVQVLSCTAMGEDDGSRRQEGDAASRRGTSPPVALLPASRLSLAADDESQGFHRSLSLSVEVQLPPPSSPSVCSLALLQHVPSGAYMDVYDLMDRHDYRITTTSRSLHHKRPRVLVHSPLAIDIEPPASISGQHAIGFVLDGLATTSTSSSSSDSDLLDLSSMQLPLHLRYPAPATTSRHAPRRRPYAEVMVSAPLVLVQCPALLDGEWVLVPPTQHQGATMVTLRVPAGEAWLRDVVVVLTAVFSLLGVVVLGHAIYRVLLKYTQQGQEEEEEGRRERKGPVTRSRTAQGDSRSRPAEGLRRRAVKDK